ncbi:hypothetical protein [Caldifermentibacillus hisashii]|uniref:hypothetical protein n=1 Tax=Caldifermentibacillus hisashii TaxID=996558 RepID=UPI0030EA2E8A
MIKKIDLTGKHFGNLTVIGVSEKRGHNNAVLWDCKCSCGNDTTATTTQLEKGLRKSCGCLRKKSPSNVNDLTGQKFGKLTVLERAGKTKNDNALWLCKCDCGNTTVAMGTSLRRGDTISCGCLKSDQIDNARKVLLEDKTVDGVQVPLLTKKVRSDSKTGYKGITRRVKNGNEYYEVYIGLKGKRHYIGSYKDIKAAIQARREAERKYHQPYIQALEGKKPKLDLSCWHKRHKKEMGNENEK